MSILKPTEAVATGLGTAALVWAVYQTHLPSVADVHGSPPDNPSVATSRRISTWTAVGIVAAVSLITKDSTVFVIGGAMVIALDYTHRYANAVPAGQNTVSVSAQAQAQAQAS
jgi:hypothetical protein